MRNRQPFVNNVPVMGHWKKLGEGEIAIDLIVLKFARFENQNAIRHCPTKVETDHHRNPFRKNHYTKMKNYKPAATIGGTSHTSTEGGYGRLQYRQQQRTPTMNCAALLYLFEHSWDPTGRLKERFATCCIKGLEELCWSNVRNVCTK